MVPLKFLARILLRLASLISAIFFHFNESLLDALGSVGPDRTLKRARRNTEFEVIYKTLEELYVEMGIKRKPERIREDIVFEDPLVVARGWREVAMIFESLGAVWSKVSVVRSAVWEREGGMEVVWIVRYGWAGGLGLDICSRVWTGLDREGRIKEVREEWGGIPLIGEGLGLLGKAPRLARFAIAFVITGLVRVRNIWR